MNIEESNIKSPFTIPEGYFGKLEENILAEVSIQRMKSLKKAATPEGYFDKLENGILSLAKIDKLQNIKSLSVPKDYFEDLESQIISQVNIDKLKDSAKSEVPEAYFDEMEDLIFSKIKIEKLKDIKENKTPEGFFDELEEQISAKVRIESLLQKTELDTPIGYFESLEENILSKTVATKKAKFTVFRNKWVYFRNAAAILLIGTFSVLVYNQSQPKDEFAEISSEDMIAYLAEESLSEEELGTIVEENAAVHENVELTEQEIEKYLKENDI
ncbi:hypothetical protein [Lacihabitans sp. CCS-44]|uniref:hypothetical protein n=1 Tax=Lacihabitans sp. CCS-44 TaxID=2487331 RepID=UPI0020CC68A1|nr:hypothetical protein [Lacihabitans sp. CCS-44]